ncbi:putative leucine-rich repeat receptor-like serine/threonine-protein kinase isoform X1 [Cinnamomum micranthum f. kanehirae]|uniref:non-specific serine/threonine protein kinase n=1 Tax=Cinnamomum micranthum f. kanehirae TaxID=337451 RepID=A0A3S3P950_9MAGN|nr:putative leucine-rich repeat receptor-like serine/threonine-protein kinase isoform X1 [Cinnamomum micranthum f. kanehirae]
MGVKGAQSKSSYIKCFSFLPKDADAKTRLEALRQIGKTLGKKNWNYSANPCTDWSDHKVTDEYENAVNCTCITNDTFCHVESIVLKGQDLQGVLPPELAKLRYLQQIDLTHNYLSGTIPAEWGTMQLVNISLLGNRITGPIPNELWNIATLTDLILEANKFSGESAVLLEGIEKLVGIKRIRINDNNFTGRIPDFTNWKKLENLAIQGTGLEGPIPSEISSWEKLTDLRISDINGTASPFPNLVNLIDIKTLILRNCNLTGTIPPYIWNMNKLKTLDLSFNMLEGQLPSTLNKPKDAVFIGIEEILSKLYINCGGEKVNATVDGTNRIATFTEDLEPGDASKYFRSIEPWAVSSTGNFLDADQGPDNYIASNKSRLTMPDSQLYIKARLSPLSLTYYGFCLWDGSYTVKLHFAEIMFSDNESYSSLYKRIFDIYIQGRLVQKDFNIEAEAGGTHKAVVRNFTAHVTTNTLEIRFYWAGKGTQTLPKRGIYGPLISAISVESGILWWKGCFRKKRSMYEDLKRLDLQTSSFTLRQLKAATNNFDDANKIGEGGFGPVYKGLLYDGTIIAVKQLSSKSKQGNREFVNEIGMISALQHPNLVKLYGCCMEGNQLLLVYEYMENNSLARALFGLEEEQLKLDWPTRHHICVGIARGLAYLHEESRLKIVHRDIKATNVLLDKDLNPKISDFGMAKLDEEEYTHISTRIAGTVGYMAPEYALRGYLTDKADVYSFGIVALEIVSGKSNTSYKPKSEGIYLLDWAHVLQERGSLIELVDPKLGSEFNKEEAIGMITIALLCTNTSSTLRPTMSAVVSMLEGRTDVQNHISEPNLSSDDLDIKDIRSHHQQIHSQEQNLSLSQSISIDRRQTVSSASASDLYPIIMDSDYWNNRE